MRLATVPVLTNTHLQDNLYKMELPFSQKAAAGQFVMVRSLHSAYPLPRPLSVSDVEDGVLTLIYGAVGRSTKELSRLKPQDKVTLTGPTGHGFPIGKFKLGDNIALVGGGTGTTPFVLTAKQLQAKGISCNAHIGFRDKSILKKELLAHCMQVHVSSESGAEGTKGFVTATLNPSDYTAVFCCGPTPMARSVLALCQEHNTPVYISMENTMGCGLGACRVCTCTLKDGRKQRTCLDGPVFLGEEVDFNA